VGCILGYDHGFTKLKRGWLERVETSTLLKAYLEEITVALPFHFPSSLLSRHDTITPSTNLSTHRRALA
jgi:hypothetical protein